MTFTHEVWWQYRISHSTLECMRTTIIALYLIIAITTAPLDAFATSPSLHVSGWIPYWRDSAGIKDAKKHIQSIDLVFPFAYTVTTQGTIKDQAGLHEKEWKSFLTYARKRNVEIMPTVMWSDGIGIHGTLSDPLKRARHIKEIVTMVEKGKYDGVDIDYESKKAETITYFSLFLAELKNELGDDKVLSCTIEARTPPESLYRDVPPVIHYANDYTEIATHCDRVQIMAYDQQRADLTLNTKRRGEPYIPVADVEWVRAVVKLALKDIPKEKIVLGIPSYGHHYTVTVSPNWFREYTRIGALNIPDMLDVAKEYKVRPTRNTAGEMSFSYMPKTSEMTLLRSLTIPKSTPKGNVVAARALAHANKTGETIQFRLGWYSDAEAMRQKIALAQELGLYGVAFFKIDGEEDQNVWKYVE